MAHQEIRRPGANLNPPAQKNITSGPSTTRLSKQQTFEALVEIDDMSHPNQSADRESRLRALARRSGLRRESLDHALEYLSNRDTASAQFALRIAFDAKGD